MHYLGHLDHRLDVLEEMRFKKSYREVQMLAIMYYKIHKRENKKSTGMTRYQLKTILHNSFDITDEDLLEHIISSLFTKPSPIVSMETWLRLMTLYLRGTQLEKINYCFNCYDTMKTGVIKRETMFNLLLPMIFEEGDTEDIVRELTEILLKKFDLDRDGKISFDDFKITCEIQPLLMEYLGQCLPSRLSTNAFLTTFTNVKKL